MPELSKFPGCCGIGVIHGFSFEWWDDEEIDDGKIPQSAMDDMEKEVKELIKDPEYYCLILATLNDNQIGLGIGKMLEKLGFSRTMEPFNNYHNTDNDVFLYHKEIPPHEDREDQSDDTVEQHV